MELLKCIEESTQENPVTTTAWATLAGVSRQTLQEYQKTLRQSGFIASVGDGNKARKYITQKGLNALNFNTAGYVGS